MSRAPEKQPRDCSGFGVVILDDSCEQYMPLWKILRAGVPEGVGYEECFLTYDDMGLSLHYPKKPPMEFVGTIRCAGCTVRCDSCQYDDGCDVVPVFGMSMWLCPHCGNNLSSVIEEFEPRKFRWIKEGLP